MRRIRLTPVLEFGSRAEFAIIDVTESPEKKRGTITVDYSPADIDRLKETGLDYDGAMDYYKERIYGLVKYYISGDWEDACAGPNGCGMAGALEIVGRHIGRYFE